MKAIGGGAMIFLYLVCNHLVLMDRSSSITEQSVRSKDVTKQ